MLSTVKNERREHPDVEVVGFTAGIAFVFPESGFPEKGRERAREIRSLVNYPLINITALGAGRALNEPYSLLVRPGGIVIDRNGVIQAVYTGPMSPQELREAFNAGDWPGALRQPPSEPVTIETRAPGYRGAYEQRWSRAIPQVSCVTPGDWDLDGSTDILIAAGSRDLRVLTLGGDPKAMIKLPDPMRRPMRIVEWTQTDSGSTAVLSYRRGWPETVDVISTTGEVLWKYPSEREMGVDAATWVDLAEGQVALAVGFNGTRGFHLASSRGKLLWRDTTVRNVWDVAGVSSRGANSPAVACTDENRWVMVYDRDGNVLARLDSGGELAGFNAAYARDVLQLICARQATVGRADKIVALDTSGAILWEFPANAVAMERKRTDIIPQDVDGDGVVEWTIRADRNRLVTLNASGQVLAELETKQEIRAWNVVSDPDAGALLVVSDTQGVTGYSLPPVQ